jgi:hypothetical protein
MADLDALIDGFERTHGYRPSTLLLSRSQVRQLGDELQALRGTTGVPHDPGDPRPTTYRDINLGWTDDDDPRPKPLILGYRP